MAFVTSEMWVALSVNPQTQVSVLRTLTYSISGLSVLGSLLILLVYWRNPRLRTFPVKILFFLSLADLCASLSHFLHFASFVPDPANPELRVVDPSESSLLSCQTQAVMQHFFFLSSFFWTLSFATNHYVQVCHREPFPAKFEVLYHLLSWGVPLASTLSLGVLHAFGPTDLWCWVSAQHQLARWTSFYGPLLAVMAAIAVLSALASRQLRRAEQKRQRTMAALGLGLGMGRMPASALHLELLAYLIAFIVIRTPSVLHR